METTKIGNWKGCPNAGYIRRLVLVPNRDIQYLPDPALLLAYTDPQLIVIGDVPIATDAQPLTFDFGPKSCQYTLTQNLSSDGHLYLIGIQGTIPKLLAAVGRELEKRRGLRWVAFFQDMNGNFYIAGTPDYPLTLTYGQSISSGNNTTVFIGGRTPSPPLNTTALPTLTRLFTPAFSRAFS